MGSGDQALLAELNTILSTFPTVPGIGAVLVKYVNGVAYVVPVVAGRRRYDRPELIQPSDIFRWDSNTKPMTGYLMACLFQAYPSLFPNGWSTTLGEVFPEFNNPACRAKYGIPSTNIASYLSAQVQDLMSHSAGLPYSPALDYEELINGFQYSSAYVPQYCNAASELHRRYLYVVTSLQDNAPPPGSNYYSGGATICGAMVERKLPGYRWEDLMMSSVFDKLGAGAHMGGRTCTNGPPFSANHPVDGVWGHAGPGAVDGNSNNVAYDFSGHAPTGDVSCDVAGIGLFLLAHLGVGLNLPLSGTPTSGNLGAYLQSARFRSDGVTRGGWFGFSTTRLAHNGGSGGFDSIMTVRPPTNDGYAVVVNSSTSDADTALSAAELQLVYFLSKWTDYTWT